MKYIVPSMSPWAQHSMGLLACSRSRLRVGQAQGAAQHGAAGMLQGQVRGPGYVGQAQGAAQHGAAGMLQYRVGQATWGSCM